MTRLRAAIAAPLFLAVAARCMAQDPSKQTDDDLLKRAASEVATFSAVEASLDALAATLGANEQAIAKARALLAEREPSPPAVPPVDTHLSPEDVDGLARGFAEFDAAVAARRKAIEDLRTLLPERQKAQAATLASLQALAQAIPSARAALGELARRVQAGTIAPDRVALDDQRRSVEAWVERLDTREKAAPALQAAMEREAAKAAEDLAALQTLAAIAPGGEREARRGRETADLLKQAIEGERNERAELEKADPSTLPTVLTRLVDDWGRETEELTQTGRKVDAELAALAAVDEERARVAPPSKEAIPEGEGHPELRLARRDAGYSDALLQSHARRIELVEKGREAVDASRQALADAGGAFDRAFRLTMRLRAAVLLCAERDGAPAPPEGITSASLWTDLRRLSSLEAQRRVQAMLVEERAKDTSAAEAAEKDLAAEKLVNARAHDQLREEESYAQFLSEMTGKSEAELLALLATDGELASRERTRASEVEAAEKLVQEEDQKARNIRETIRPLENPYVQFGVARGAARAQEIQKELEKAREAKDGQLPLDQSARPMGIDLTAPLPSEAVATTERTEPAVDSEVAEKARLEQEQTFAKELLRYFRDLQASLDRWDASLQAFDTAGQALVSRLSDLVNEKKRGHACARELERRYEAGKVTRADLPADLDGRTSREPIHAAEKQRDDALRTQALLRERRQQELAGLRNIAALQSWAGKQSEYADRKAVLIGRPVAHLASARTSYESLPEVQKKALTYKSEVRRTGEDEWSTRLLSRFMESTARERFEDPLGVYYLETVDSDRAVDEYGNAAEAYEGLVEAAIREREELSGLPAALREATPLRVFNYQVARHVAAIAAAPEKQAQIESAFRSAFQKDLPLPSDTRGWSIQYWGDQLLASELRLWGHLKWIAESERRLSKLGLEADIARYRKSLARISGEMDVQRLLLERLSGEIASVREGYRAQSRRDALWSFAQVLLIPVIAWLFLRTIRRFARRIEKAAKKAGTDDTSERRRRVSTLARVSGKAISTTVWIVTFMYVLGQLGVNITPILASAGVVGLAIAFGAQTMIKDFLSGFFILLENQFRIGDVINLEGVGGVVERITLRVTVLRDLQGTVHYIPNGTLTRVSNLTQGWSRVVLEVSVGYGEDIDRVIVVLRDVLAKLREDPAWASGVLESEVSGVESLGESSVDVRVMVKTPPMRQWDVARELRRRIKMRFDDEGIEIPFPQRVIHHVQAPSEPDESGPAPEPRQP
ncbi:MAG: mechanosensitive ion channel domain-containing protein [Planctomycetota bacterium]